MDWLRSSTRRRWRCNWQVAWRLFIPSWLLGKQWARRKCYSERWIESMRFYGSSNWILEDRRPRLQTGLVSTSIFQNRSHRELFLIIETNEQRYPYVCKLNIEDLDFNPDHWEDKRGEPLPCPTGWSALKSDEHACVRAGTDSFNW